MLCNTAFNSVRVYGPLNQKVGVFFLGYFRKNVHKKFAYDLDWITKYRNVRYQEVLNRFGSVSGDELAALLLDKEKPLSIADQKLIRQFQLADLSYRTLRAKLWASVLAAAGGSIGLATALFAHINRHPAAKWRRSVEGEAAD